MTTTIQVRPGDCDTYGHVNNAAYITYMEYAFTNWLKQLGFDIGPAWMLAGNDSWQPAEIVAVYTRPAYIGDTLQAAMWAEQAGPEELATGCTILHPAGDVALHGYAKWRRVDRQTGESRPIPPEIRIAVATEHSKPAGVITPALERVAEPARELPVFCWSHTVRRSEIRAGDWVHPAAFFHWIEEAIYVASASVGWPAERIVGDGMIIVQHRHDLQINALPRRGETVKLVSRVVEVRKIRGTWRHDIYRQADNTLLAQNWSVGVFMTRDGRLCRPPAKMMSVFGWG